LLAVTSADRLHAGWTAARRIRRDNRGSKYISHRLGGVCGHRMEALGVERFGQTGTIPDLYRHYGIDANAIIDAAEG
jgi:pyruvate dehydrogenase E1 component